MPFIRLCDSYIDHPKFTALSASAFRLWHEGMAFCRKHQTDGFISRIALHGFRYYQQARVKELTSSITGESGPLWETVKDGFQMRNYLKWNLSKEAENEHRKLAKHRNAFLLDKGLKSSLRARDGDKCRYCGVAVNWLDRKGALGATYDHVEPAGDATLENLVISCRGCNSKKRNRNPRQAGMELRNPPDKSSRNLDTNLDSTGLDMDRSSVLLERVQGKPNHQALIVSDAHGDRAASFLEKYAELYRKHRHGAKLLRQKPALDWDRGCQLCGTWDDERLEKMAVIFLTTDDEWICGTDRSFGVFFSKASWCDERLSAWEAKRAAS